MNRSITLADPKQIESKWPWTGCHSELWNFFPCGMDLLCSYERFIDSLIHCHVFGEWIPDVTCKPKVIWSGTGCDPSEHAAKHMAPKYICNLICFGTKPGFSNGSRSTNEIIRWSLTQIHLRNISTNDLIISRAPSKQLWLILIKIIKFVPASLEASSPATLTPCQSL